MKKLARHVFIEFLERAKMGKNVKIVRPATISPILEESPRKPKTEFPFFLRSGSFDKLGQILPIFGLISEKLPENYGLFDLTF